MYCRFCGKEIQEDSNFCPNCGAKQKEQVYRTTSLLKRNMTLFLFYLFWCIINVGLFCFSSPKGYYYKYINDGPGRDSGPGYHEPQEKIDYDLSGGFYPFDEPLSDVFQGKKYNCSLLDNVNVYDSSELFFYVVLLPIVLFGVVKITSTIVVRIKAKTNKPLKKRKALDSEGIIALVETDTNKDTEEKNQNDVGITRMPLLRRLIGSFIDKILLLVIFVIGYYALDYYEAPHNLGAYTALIFTSNFYSPYDLMLDLGSDFYESMRSLDLGITFSFIALNLVYYITSEWLLSASLGKRLLGGVLIVEAFNEKVGLDKVLARAIYGGIFMSATVGILHFLFGLSYIYVAMFFFLMIDIPVLTKKKSLIDLCTETVYIKS